MDKSRIPNRLKKYRRLAGLSQKEVAAILGLKNTSCISRWEKGLGFPGVMYLFQLSFLYKTMPNELYFEMWQTVKQQLITAQQDLLAQHEQVITNETYLL